MGLRVVEGQRQASSAVGACAAAAGCSACAAVHEQQQQQAVVHEQQQQAAGVLQCMSSSSSRLYLRSMVWQAVLLVAQLETQQKEWGVADKDTRALARQSQAKIKQAHQLVDQLALWEVLGTTQHPNQVRVTSSQLRSMVRGEPAPWERESQTSQEGKVLFFGRQFFHLLSDSQRCLEQLALLKLERARLNAWLHFILRASRAAYAAAQAGEGAPAGEAPASSHTAFAASHSRHAPRSSERSKRKAKSSNQVLPAVARSSQPLGAARSSSQEQPEATAKSSQKQQPRAARSSSQKEHPMTVDKQQAAVHEQQQQAVGVWQCWLQVATGCRCTAVHEQQQQVAMHVLQWISSSSRL
ncbi:hypothetical protein QJQ45_014812 [Haematococcus lacustris]|nr:hypothetical protein QJQ45_014812 [Haematococcus lacustris]